MRWILPSISCLFLILVLGCSPALNWRELRPVDESFKVMMPCKPDVGERPQVLEGKSYTLTLAGCETAGAIFVVGRIELNAGQASAAQVQAAWQSALMSKIKVRDSGGRHVAVSAASRQADQHMNLTVAGVKEDGKEIQLQAAWFARGARLYHAAIYARRISEEMAEPFFGGIALQ